MRSDRRKVGSGYKILYCGQGFHRIRGGMDGCCHKLYAIRPLGVLIGVPVAVYVYRFIIMKPGDDADVMAEKVDIESNMNCN
jgi:hypothetical protein